MKKILVCLTQFIMILMTSTMVYGEQAGENVTQGYQESASLYVEGYCFMKNYVASYEYMHYFPRGVTYDESTNTLTLENCNLQYRGGAGGRSGVIEYIGNRTLNIVIKGNNKINTGEKNYAWYVIMNDAISISSLDDTKEVQVNIMGNGILEVDNVDDLINAYRCNINVLIGGVTIHSNFAGIYCGGTLAIKKAKVFIKDSSDEWFSLSEIGKSFKLICSQYDFEGEHVYAGNGKLDKEIDSDEMFEEVNIRGTEMYQKKKKYDWVLLSDEVADLRDYNPVPETTSVKAPGKAKIKSITAKKKSTKKVKLLLKKIRGAKGYQVAVYKIKKNAAKNKKVIVKKFVKKTSVTVTSKKLKNKKTLYVKVRAYKLDGKKKIYGKWSKVKKVKIKK
ncbi:MAG: hypothetical protein HFG31_04705 [Eubacterium sp.]|nr:hypothetical protein [Eubacterium sp.]